MGLSIRMLKSTVMKKYVMALSGLALTGFLAGHLAGNLQLLIPGGVMFNKYAHHLESLGKMLWVIEAGLVAVFLVHIAFAIMTNQDSASARPVKYEVEATKGGESKNNFSSRNMLLLGFGIVVFLVVHIWHFKYGAYYPTDYHGEPGRDLYRLVNEQFHHIGWVAFYCGMMLFILFHLRHGIWSAFQSIGAMPRGWSIPTYIVAGLLALAIAFGFILLPIVVYFMPLASAAGVAH